MKFRHLIIFISIGIFVGSIVYFQLGLIKKNHQLIIYYNLLIDCQIKLPRDQYCILIAVPEDN